MFHIGSDKRFLHLSRSCEEMLLKTRRWCGKRNIKNDSYEFSDIIYLHQ